MFSRSTPGPTPPHAPRSASMRCPSNWWRTRVPPFRRCRGIPAARTTSTSGMAPPISFSGTNRLPAGRHVAVTERRTRSDWAHAIRDLVDVHYPDAETIVLVLDNLNTHPPASLYAAFEPAEAKRIADKLEIHYTPKHGSWLNVAEIELAILTTQCTGRRIPDQASLTEEVAAWEEARNAAGTGVNWRFTTEDARIKLKHLYPSHDA